MNASDASVDEERSPWGVAAVALIAALLQILASVVLGLARLDQFTKAASEGAYNYLIVAALLGVGVFCVWFVRDRVAVAATLAVLWPLGLWYGLRVHTTRLGLAYYGEFILHHFTALLCLLLAVTVPLGWARDRRLGKFRAAPLALALPGALLLAAAHLGQIPLGPHWLQDRSLANVGAALLFGAWPLAGLVFFPALGPRQRRPLVFVLLLPLVVRLALAGWDGLSGALVGPESIHWLGAALIATVLASLILLRPRLEFWVMFVVGFICLLGSALIWALYYGPWFGDLEDNLGGLLQSLFGFELPYPSYVDEVRAAALMMGLFFMLVTVYSSLVSMEDRIRGIALGLMMLAGVGFSSPHLVLMFGVGALLVVETMLPGAPYRELDDSLSLGFGAVEAELDASEPDPPAKGANEGETEAETELARLLEIVEGLADRLSLGPPTLARTGAGAGIISLRGELDGPMLDLRARVEPKSTRVELSIGLPGRDDPVFELIPDVGKRGKRPAHLLARSHRVAGELRALEAFGDAPLDALSSFPTAYLRAWDGGVQLELGRELVSLRVDALDALVRSLARALESGYP